MTRDELLERLSNFSLSEYYITPEQVKTAIAEAGFTLVPREPTFEMIEAALCIDNPVIDVYDETRTAQESHNDLRSRYKAMLAKAEEG